MLNAAADIHKHGVIRQRRQAELSPGKIDRVGQVWSGIGKRAVEIEHHQLQGFFHRE
jgi:hypothetical protein